jgi:para-nitrobenzyl esterase
MSVIKHHYEIDTPQGGLLGELIRSSDETSAVAVFKGIPYAAPPVGAMRWKPAVPAPSWQSTRLATQFSPSAMQLGSDDKTFFFYNPSFPCSEDCLYLNVWTPQSVDQKNLESLTDPLPVMIWFHGGGLLCGSGSEPCYDGAELARKGAVVITVNYRLGVFGYFSHPALSAESGSNASGNYGTTDQIQALKWVQENIAAFGGDRKNVTIFGESAGALSVSHLLASPLASGLFHQAIMQSAYLPPMPQLKQSVYGFEAAESYGYNYAKSLGIEGDDKRALQTLRDIPADQLLQVSSLFEFDKAVVDGWVFQQQIFETFEQGKQDAVPVLAGFNRNEGSYFPLIGMAPMPQNTAAYTAAVMEKYGPLAEQYLAIYPANDIYKSSYSAMGEGLYAWGTEYLARMMQATPAPAYLYCFDHAPEWAAQQGLGAFHTTEFIYTFNNIRHNPKYSQTWPDIKPRQSDIVMADLLSDYWLAFARSGVPAVADQPMWPAYQAPKHHYMFFHHGQAQVQDKLIPDKLALHDANVAMRKRNGQGWTYKEVGLLAESYSDKKSDTVENSIHA